MCYCYFFLQKIYVVFEGHILLFQSVSTYSIAMTWIHIILCLCRYLWTIRLQTLRWQGKRMLLKLLYYQLEYQLRSLRNHKSDPCRTFGHFFRGDGFWDCLIFSFRWTNSIHTCFVPHQWVITWVRRDVGETTLVTTVCERRGPESVTPSLTLSPAWCLAAKELHFQGYPLVPRLGDDPHVSGHNGRDEIVPLEVPKIRVALKHL